MPAFVTCTSSRWDSAGCDSRWRPLHVPAFSNRLLHGACTEQHLASPAAEGVPENHISFISVPT